MVSGQDLQLQDGRVPRVHDSAAGRAADALTVLWQPGAIRRGRSRLVRRDGRRRRRARGREAREHYAEREELDPASFTERDYAALDGTWSSLSADVGVASAAGADGLIDDDVAFVSPWGFEVTEITAPVPIVHGGADRVIPFAHGEWLLRHCPDAELWVRPHDGHISVLDACPVAMDWLRLASFRNPEDEGSGRVSPRVGASSSRLR